MLPVSATSLLRICSVYFLMQIMYLQPVIIQPARGGELEPLRLSFQGSSVQGIECDQHPSAASHAGKDKGGVGRPEKKGKGRPQVALESEHRPVPRRTYYFNEHRRRAVIKSYVRRPNGEVIEPELLLGVRPHVSFSTPYGDGPAHGANSVYVVEKGVTDNGMLIRTAKWITMHHSCSWGHDGKFDTQLTVPQPLETIPFEIVVDKLWDTNFHLNVQSGDMLDISVLSFGKPVAGATVSLASEMGWTKMAKTDDNGKVFIQLIRDYYPPLWSAFKRSHRGEFLITADYDSDDNGSFRGTDYTRTQYITTLQWQYSPSSRDYASYSSGLALGFFSMTISGIGVFFYRERRRKPYRGIRFDE